MDRPRNSGWRLLAGILAGVMILVLVYRGGRWLETQGEAPEARGDHQMRRVYTDTITVDGVSYTRRDSVTSILLMGIDRDSQAEVVGFRNGGQADFLQLLAIDTRNKTVTQIPIDRDTMTPITILGVLGNPSGTRMAQICLAHGFGDGKEQSCQLTAQAVSNLLAGVPIDEYIAMNLDGISVLNDAVGGITVTLEEDFSALDPTMTRGKHMTLAGDQAEIYVRTRRNIGVGTNEARMERQRLYIEELTRLLQARLSQDQNFAGVLFDDLSPYLTTGISRGTLVNQAWQAKDYARQTRTLPGSHQEGSDGFMQFYPDAEQIQTMILELFYEKV